jgi:triosephosphate isomerase (TIM)
VKALRRPVLAGNWKLNKDPAETHAFFEQFLQQYASHEDRTVLFFPPSISLAAAVDAVRERPDVQLGVQNIYWEASGAFTGEISAPLARGAGAAFVLVGHSERRHVFGESIEDTQRKTRAALEADLLPVLCVGEKLDERRGGRAEAVVAGQLDGVLGGMSAESAARILIAYEPVWAIGTGETASPQDASGMHRSIRQDLVRRYGDAPAREIPILYGGSVNTNNVAELLAAPEIDGVLVGGASLDPRGFAQICGGAY